MRRGEGEDFPPVACVREKKWKETVEDEISGGVVVRPRATTPSFRRPREEEPAMLQRTLTVSHLSLLLSTSSSPPYLSLPPSHPPLRKSAVILDIVHDTGTPRS